MPLPTTASPPPTVRFGRRPDRGLLLGFSGPRIGCLATAFAGLTLAVFTGGPTRLLQTLPLWAASVALAFVTWQGRLAIEALPTAGHYVTRLLLGQTRFRGRDLMQRGRQAPWRCPVTSRHFVCMLITRPGPRSSTTLIPVR